MRLRLQITPSSDKPFTVEHTTPLLRIGRDPSCELALAGDRSQGVSWDHAHVELTSGGAILSDRGSRNGTYVNGQRLDRPARLRVGDEVQLGRGGPRLLVLEVDLIGAPAETSSPAATARAGRQSGWGPALRIGAVAAAFCALVALTAIVMSHDPEPPPPPPPPGPSGERVEGPPQLVKPPEPTPPDPKPPEEKKPDPKPIEVKPVAERRTGGRYEPSDASPSVLLQRRDKDDWKRVRPEGRVQPGDVLVSLPSCRSEVQMDSGVRLVLWGNLPEQLNLPILESAVVLHEPAPETDLSFTLDRGRVVIANSKKDGPVQVQVRFGEESWDVTLADSASEVGIELIGRYTRDVGFRAGQGPRAELYLLVLKGQAGVKIGFRNYGDLKASPGPALFAWDNQGNPGLRGPTQLEQMPAVWGPVPPPDAKAEPVTRAVRELSDQMKEAANPEAALKAMLRGARPADRSLGVLCLGAIDALPPLVDALADPQHAEVRGAAIFALRHWIGRRAEHDAILYELLPKQGYTKSESEVIMQYLHNLSESQCALPETFAVLIDYLRHDKLAIRELAYWHLSRLVPDGRKIPYDPAGDAAQRKRAYEQWKKLVPDGKLPPKPTAPPRPQP